MTGWIKHDKALSTKPEVIAMARSLGIDRWSVVGRCEEIWSWADEHTVDGNARCVTPAFLDDIVSCDGFADAMRSVGWLEVSGDGLTIPKFDRHNGNSGKRRALTQERVKKHRAKRNAKCNAASVTDSSLLLSDLGSSSSDKGESEGAASSSCMNTYAAGILQHYPRGCHGIRGEAYRAIGAAIRRLMEDGRSVRDAVGFLEQRTAEYAKARKGERKYTPNAARWFDGDAYLQDGSEWARAGPDDKPSSMDPEERKRRNEMFRQQQREDS